MEQQEIENVLSKNNVSKTKKKKKNSKKSTYVKSNKVNPKIFHHKMHACTTYNVLLKYLSEKVRILGQTANVGQYW